VREPFGNMGILAGWVVFVFGDCLSIILGEGNASGFSLIHPLSLNSGETASDLGGRQEESLGPHYR
jgi:hypothetical protein